MKHKINFQNLLLVFSKDKIFQPKIPINKQKNRSLMIASNNMSLIIKLHKNKQKYLNIKKQKNKKMKSNKLKTIKIIAK